MPAPAVRDYQFNEQLMNNPGHGSTFPVYSGVHVASNKPVVGKVFDSYNDADRRKYVQDEIKFNDLTRQYDWIPLAQMVHHCELPGAGYIIIFMMIDGQVLNEQTIAAASAETKMKWLLDVAFGLSCCHMNDVFHQDLADLMSAPTINIMIEHATGRLVIIDLGDAEHCTAAADAQAATIQDIRGLSTLANEHLFPGGSYPDEDMRAVAAALTNEAAVPATNSKMHLHQVLTQLEYQFPPGIGGMMAAILGA